MKWKDFILLLFGGTVLWCFIFELFILKYLSGEFFSYFQNVETHSHLKSLFIKAPVLEERLLLIDKNLLQIYHDMEKKNLSYDQRCVFCRSKKNQPITFALLCPTNSSLEEHVLLPILRAWEIGFWVESIISSKPRKFSTYHANLPLGFILQKGGGAVIVEIVLLHEREGDFWWHGSFYQDAQYKSKFSNLGLKSSKHDLVLKKEGAFDKFVFKSIVIDNNVLNIPNDIPLFLKESSPFIECNYELADKFYRTYGKDTTPRALKFIHKARKLLSTAKTVLDQLQIPFWISSGTLLGYYRQCDVIPYTGDVDIGIFGKDYKEEIIKNFKAARLKLKHRFGRVDDSFELSFTQNQIKLDIFFFYDDGKSYWNGGHQLFRKNETSYGAYKYKYTFPKFTLCWTEFLDLKVRIPCQIEAYIKANYGPDWFIPVPKWDWAESPFNVQKIGEWSDKEIGEVKKMLFQKILLRNKGNLDICQKLALSTSVLSKENNFGKIKSWQVHSYGGLEELQLTNSRSPFIGNPDDVLVQVSAASVNPIDIAMMNGYGSVLLNFMRQTKSCTLENVLEFPLTLGRDFSGVIIQKGLHVDEEFLIGDEVWGVVPVYEQGCHAEQVLVTKNCIKKKPKNISMIEAASMLYAAVTAWSALKITGDLAITPAKGKTVLVLGGSGGVGTMAVQMLSSWGANVITTCSTDAVPLLESLGIIDIIDYKKPDFLGTIQKYKYDIVLDCAGLGQDNATQYLNCLKDYKFSKYITLKSPMLKNFDEYGMMFGMMKNAADLMFVNITTGILPKWSTVRWGFFLPFEKALNEITEEVSKGKLIPVIQKTYPFAELPAAYQHVHSGHLRGKIVIDVGNR